MELALRQADIIIYSAGTQHSSLYPTYLASGLARTISCNRSALKVFVTNIGTDHDTPNYKASDYLHGAYRYLNGPERRQILMQDLFDVILVNKSKLERGETNVEHDEGGYADIPPPRIVEAFKLIAAPSKHDGVKIVETILDLYERSSCAAMRA